MGFSVNIFHEEPERDMICCVCMGVFEDPVKDACGHSFCSSCLTPWLRKTGRCPISNQPISQTNPNYYLTSRIDGLKIKCVECEENYIEFHQREDGCNRCQSRRYSDRNAAALISFDRNNARDQQQKTSSRAMSAAKWGGIAAIGLAAVTIAASAATKSKPKRRS